MNWTIKLVCPEHRTYDGILVPHEEKEFEVPFKFMETVYYVHRKKWRKKNSPWVITKSEVRSVWATNIVGVTIGNNIYISEDEFDLLFRNKEEAIEFCLKKNSHRQVKIYGE